MVRVSLPLRYARSERTWALLLTLLAAVVRLWGWSELAIDHFDEGVYASNLWFGEEHGYRYPLRHLYAPPLLPGWIEFCIGLGGGLSATSFRTGPLWPSLLTGILLTPSVWWVGRTWFSPRIGLSAAALTCGLDLAILLSRSALTDSLLAFWVLWAVWCGERALRRPAATTTTVTFTLAAGLLTALAWWTKYNGWLPLAILGAAVPLNAVQSGLRHARGLGPKWQLRDWAEQLVILISIAIIAALLWSPVVFGLRSTGGYAAVAANHGRYVVGLNGWWNSLLTQWHHLKFLDSGLGIVLAPVLAASFLARRAAGWQRTTGLLLLLIAVSLWIGSVSTWLLFVVVTSIASVASSAASSGAGSSAAASSVAGSSAAEFIVPPPAGGPLVTAWLVGLVAATPCYHPYPRLLLPALVALLLATAWSLDWWLTSPHALFRQLASSPTRSSAHQPSREPYREPSALPHMLLYITALGLLCGALATGLGKACTEVPAVWQSRRDLLRATAELRDQVVDPATRVAFTEPREVFYVYGEPAVYYHLNALGERLVFPVGSFDFLRRDIPPGLTVYFLFGPHAADDAAFIQEWQEQRTHFEPVAETRVRPSPLSALDAPQASQLRRGASPRREPLELWRLKRSTNS